ncbi:histidine--tRNA ligase [Natranaerobius thermophilus]|uniref:Histidine--tRNA ligase n=1 Tax=Natranaerobius thermophilus (strain ATCC BAA-1301 / DSM 18059 / JW/NM-WN-LF) TaxID=457570 RepID=SYH_NATTJ|nr:histidine--tRNA ligase [Natranaerobius thermophilus]B2A2F9.1 RecName: Full=Histidine--tRNA ligase; AltName: Full=Histidyl-tRNA synthetase; Short=HisRS [Natranaerobius thermophilus JW/NM-WN-LF]ACB84874.1 histidyl-tRNA synthetase [Natranaerobius thermophilus JW/NM-WN-LF]
MLTKAPRGTKDILPQESSKWHALEETAKKISNLYGFNEVRFPIFEHTELFTRSVGETSDIVSKEMYTFTDRGDRSLTLRPEGTAPAARLYVEHKLFNEPQPVKYYYIGPMFRYDRPQAGRYRQFHQFGVEVFGSLEPETDVEVMKLLLDYFEALGLSGLELKLNSVGCKECRQKYLNELSNYFEGKIDHICQDCYQRYQTNPMRVLDCKKKSCREAIGEDVPLIVNYLCQDCATHFDKVKEILTSLNLPYQIDPHLVRGLDYYTKTAFEVVMPSLGAQDALGGGGRYDYLVEECGGPPTPGVGFAVGLERILLALEQKEINLDQEEKLDFYFIATGEEAKQEAFKLLATVREEGYSAVMDFERRSMRAQMKRANKANARFSLILGEAELNEQTCQIKDMEAGEQFQVPLKSFEERIKEIAG